MASAAPAALASIIAGSGQQRFDPQPFAEVCRSTGGPMTAEIIEFPVRQGAAPLPSAGPAGDNVTFGPFRLWPAERRLEKSGRPVAVGGRALDILVALIKRPGEVVSKQELMRRVWPDVAVEEFEPSRQHREPAQGAGRSDGDRALHQQRARTRLLFCGTGFGRARRPDIRRVHPPGRARRGPAFASHRGPAGPGKIRAYRADERAGLAGRKRTSQPGRADAGVLMRERGRFFEKSGTKNFCSPGTVAAKPEGPRLKKFFCFFLFTKRSLPLRFDLTCPEPIML